MASRPQSSSSSAPSSSASDLPAFLRHSKPELAAKFVDLEWQQRERLSQGLQTTTAPSKWARLSGDHIFARNRYLNVEPFASNRVKLDVPAGISDYINASPITLGNRRYIATQGPKDSSTSHFYRMLASQTDSPAVVVMLTQTHEAGREKCFPYFPSSLDAPIQITPDTEDDTFQGQVSLVSVEEDSKSRCTIRKLLMRTRATEGATWSEKEICHLLFSGWADFSIPEGENRQAMLELIELSSRLNTCPTAPSSSSLPTHQQGSPASESPSPSLSPRIVHCSAGVGRSGTFIALDYLLAELENGHLDNIPETADPVADTVDRLRQQRMMMVQGESQFYFLYDVLRQAWIKRRETQAQVQAQA